MSGCEPLLRSRPSVLERVLLKRADSVFGWLFRSNWNIALSLAIGDEGATAIGKGLEHCPNLKFLR